MEMSADEIDKLFESYEFPDHKLTRNVVFQELLKLAVEDSDCLIEEVKSKESQKRALPSKRDRLPPSKIFA